MAIKNLNHVTEGMFDIIDQYRSMFCWNIEELQASYCLMYKLEGDGFQKWESAFELQQSYVHTKPPNMTLQNAR